MKNKWLNVFKFIVLPARLLVWIFAFLGMVGLIKAFDYDIEYDLLSFETILFAVFFIFIFALIYITVRTFLDLFHKKPDSIKKTIKFLIINGILDLFLILVTLLNNLHMINYNNNFHISHQRVIFSILLTIAFYGINIYYFNNRINIYNNTQEKK